MGRIKNVDESEVNELRRLMLKQFKQRNPTQSLPPLNAYLPNYEELRLDILKITPESNGSVSQNRLRKLFYYAGQENDDITIQGSKFGIDFLDACYLYVSNNQMDRRAWEGQKTAPVESVELNKIEKKRPARLLRFALISAIVVISLFSWGISTNDQIAVDFQDDFSKNTRADLIRNGWEVMDENTKFLEKQIKSDHLTLYTLPGSYWVKPDEPIEVINTLVHPLHKQSQGVRVCLRKFRPDHDWQAFCIILYNNDLDREMVAMVSFGHASSLIETHGSPLVATSCLMVNGVPKIGDSWYQRSINSGQSDGETIRLEIRWSDDEFISSVGVNKFQGYTQEWEGMTEFGRFPKPFKPSFFGLAANQGWTNDQRQPLKADTIPVHIDWVEVF